MLVPGTVSIRRLFVRPLPLVLLVVLLVIIIYRHFLAEARSVTASSSVAVPSSRSYAGIGPSKELVVVSLRGEDTSWIREHLPDWNSSIFVVDDPHAKLTVPVNKGREAMAYLT
jgi:hypothetical protein